MGPFSFCSFRNFCNFCNFCNFLSLFPADICGQFFGRFLSDRYFPADNFWPIFFLTIASFRIGVPSILFAQQNNIFFHFCKEDQVHLRSIFMLLGIMKIFIFSILQRRPSIFKEFQNKKIFHSSILQRRPSLRSFFCLVE